jgi:hypothetical protein
VAGVGSYGLCGVNVSDWGARAVTSAAHREASEEWFEEEGKEEGGGGVPLQGSAVNVEGGGGAVRGDVVCGRDPVELFACVDKGGGIPSCRMCLNMMRWSRA